MYLFEIQSSSIILYRAMSQDEANKTLANQKPFFNKRYKWFSKNLDFVLNRVQGSNFAHSKFKVEPYSAILKFYINKADFPEFKRLNNKEVMLNVRSLPLVRFQKIEELEYDDYIR